MEFNEDSRGESRFWDHTFLQTEFAKMPSFMVLLIGTRGQVLLKRGTDVGSQAPMLSD